MTAEKGPVVPGTRVWLPVSVGAGKVDQHNPLVVMVSPPSAVTFPPEAAESEVIPVTRVSVHTAGSKGPVGTRGASELVMVTTSRRTAAIVFPPDGQTPSSSVLNAYREKSSLRASTLLTPAGLLLPVGITAG